MFIRCRPKYATNPPSHLQLRLNPIEPGKDFFNLRYDAVLLSEGGEGDVNSTYC